jgi:hypothetical protein
MAERKTHMIELENTLISNYLSRRAEATVGHYSARPLESLSQADLVKLTRALATVLAAAAQGRRPGPPVLGWAWGESQSGTMA